jgi:hypothetical protein
MKRIYQSLISIVVAAGSLSVSTIAQKLDPQKQSASTCEEVRHAFDESLVRMSNHNSTLIFIIQLGSRENPVKSNKIRVNTIENHIKMRWPAFSNYVIAQTGASKGLAKLSIFIEGKLVFELFANRNADWGYNCRTEPF